MRLHWERRDGVVVYVDGSPKSSFWRWVRALAAFAGAAFLIGALLLAFGSSFWRAAGGNPASAGWLALLSWGLGTALSFRLVLLGWARLEVEPSEKRRALVFRRVYLWGPSREREHRRPDVEAVALRALDRGGPYLELKLILADGRMLFVQEGKQMDRMQEMARDVAAALRLPVTYFPVLPRNASLTSRLTRLTLTSGEVRWVDFDYASRLVATWAACLGSLLLFAFSLLAVFHSTSLWWTVGKSDVPLFGFLILAGLAVVGALSFVCAVACLRLPRYRGLRLPLSGGCVVLQRLGISGRRWDETLLVDGATAVVLVRNRKGVPRQIWLRRPGGKRLYIDGGRDADLAQLARDLERPLRVSIQRESRRFFLL
ncbi:MAG TPA: hypothetical protein VMS17_22985 [Gemmataceae bacterium]|nr:hypothetical protein [Gemmataceae bacterium]